MSSIYISTVSIYTRHVSGGAAAGAGVAAAGLDQAPAPRHHHGGAHTRHRERSPVAQAGGQAGALTRASAEHGLP